jgi:PPM family protein phosphatase
MSVGLRDEATVPSDFVRSLVGLVHTPPTDASRDATRTQVDSWAATTAVGSNRADNEDAWGQRSGTFVVADGMGGRPGGATAATAAVAAALDVFTDAEPLHPLDWSTRVAAVNEAVMSAGRRAGHDHVGAAIAIVRCGPGSVVISHAGDVRIYRLRDGEVQLLTRDHTVRAEINSAGRDPDTMVAARGKTAALTSFVGGTTSWQRHSLRALDARHGDHLVVCTDGVHRRLDRHDWHDAARRHHDCQAFVDAIVERAAALGSTDDRTALMVRIGPRS